ncbi:MAG: hypothetical protein HYZ93_06545 [Candidatus Omnitrophica bacterium]|nr:hypothetical protein [Candidatus Omnitrophota bacterium]
MNLARAACRVLDANLNRAREGLRVCEEAARFILEDGGLTRRSQRIRYDLAAAARRIPRARLLKSRDSRADVGRPSERGPVGRHRNIRDLIMANGKRVQEALRVLEEFSRLQSPQTAKAFGSLRFRVYSLEQDLLSRL